MAYPKITDYLEALQKSRSCLHLADLSQASFLPGFMGRPKYYSGAFAIVVPLRLGTTTKAIRMFTMHVEDGEAHYKTIHAYLRATRLPYFVDFAYHPQGMTVGGQTYPVVVMDWLEGQTLKAFVKAHLHDNVALLRVADAWRQMLLQLAGAKIAHGDLQEANVFVQPSGFGFHLRLLDYDSLVIPALEGRPETIQGVPAYQHPLRRTLRTKSLAVDTFSALVIDLSLRALTEAPRLWDDWKLDDTEASLLFEADDYKQPHSSAKLRHLQTLSHALKSEVLQFVSLCEAASLASLPSLSSLWSPSSRSGPLPDWLRPRLTASSPPSASTPPQPPPILRIPPLQAAAAPAPLSPRKPGEQTTIPGLGGATLVWCPPGIFLLGSDNTDSEAFSDEKPQHQVTLTRGFWMLETPVTQAEWQTVAGFNPSLFKDAGPNAPVECVSWYEAVWFCNQLSKKDGLPEAYRWSGMKGQAGEDSFELRRVEWVAGSLGYRLPTEAEWEYACRAGTTLSRYGKLDEIAWYNKNSSRKTHPVGEKQANDWGLHDLLGNLLEWSWDCYGNYAAGAQVDPAGPSSGSGRVSRGGSQSGDASYARASYRSSNVPSGRGNNLGFRVVRLNP